MDHCLRYSKAYLTPQQGKTHEPYAGYRYIGWRSHARRLRQIRCDEGTFDGNEVNAAFVEYIVDKAEDRPDLTDNQRDQLKAMVEKMASRALDERPETDALREKMAEEVRKPRLDMDMMEALMKARIQLFRIIMDEEKDYFASFHSKLTPGQKEDLAKLILDHGNKGWHGSL